MDLVLRAYDEAAVNRAESLPVRQLWTLLESGGLWDSSKVRVGLSETADVYSRETVVARLESLVQEGHAEHSLRRLRGSEPRDLATLRRAHWPVIDEEEAIQLHEDLIRYLTYGLWQAPEEVVARALGILTGRSGAAFLVGGGTATEDIQSVMDMVEDERAFADRYSSVVRAALKQRGEKADDAAVALELAQLGQLLGPVRRMLRGAHDAGLRVIAYQDKPGHDGLTRYLATAMQAGAFSTRVEPDEPAAGYGDLETSNGHDSSDQ